MLSNKNTLSAPETLTTNEVGQAALVLSPVRIFSPAQERQMAERQDSLDRMGDAEGLTPEQRLRSAQPELTQLVTRMAPDIKAGRWSGVIVDGISAQPVGAILHRVMERWHGRHSQDMPLFLNVTPVHFNQDDLDQNWNEVYGRVAEQAHQIGSTDKRRLILSETINTGQTVRELAAMTVNAAGEVMSDVAIVHGYEGYDKWVDGKFYWGGEPRDDSTLYSRGFGTPAYRHAIGYEKDGMSPVPRQLPDDDAIIGLRAEERAIADEIYDKVFQAHT